MGFFYTRLKLRLNRHNFKEMILEIKAMIAKFDNVSRETTAKKPAKKCVVHSEFLFSLFSDFCCCGGCTELASTVGHLQVHIQRFNETSTGISSELVLVLHTLYPAVVVTA